MRKKTTTKLGITHHLFSEDKDNQIEDWLQKVNDFFSTLITNNNSNVMDEINKKLVDSIAIGCRIGEPNVVILEAEDSPSTNESIFETCRAYFKDLNIEEGRLDIWADQAIHQRLLKFDDDKHKENCELV